MSDSVRGQRPSNTQCRMRASPPCPAPSCCPGRPSPRRYNSTGAQGYNQQWHYDTATGNIVSLMNGLCVTAMGFVAGAPVRTDTCTTSNPSQQWAYNATSGAFTVPSAPGLCLDAGASVSCTMPPYSGYTYCDPDASVDARVADLVPRLLPFDFQALLANDNPGVPRLGIPRIEFSECLHGEAQAHAHGHGVGDGLAQSTPVGMCAGTLTGCGAPYTDPATGYTSTGCPTSFPHALLMSSSFNRSLWSAVGSAISTEDRALHNQQVSERLVRLDTLSMWPHVRVCRSRARCFGRPTSIHSAIRGEVTHPCRTHPSRIARSVRCVVVVVQVGPGTGGARRGPHSHRGVRVPLLPSPAGESVRRCPL